MKYALMLLLSVLCSEVTFGQFKVKCEQGGRSVFEIVQVDVMEFSTLLYLQVTDSETRACSLSDDKIYIEDEDSHKCYGLINSINMPLGESCHVFDVFDSIHVHYFVLEFERISDTTDLISIRSKGYLDFSNIKIERGRKYELLNIDKYVNQTPVREFTSYYKDGELIFMYKHNGLVVMMSLYESSAYGKYFQPQILIQNFTGKTIQFYPSNIRYNLVYKNKSLSGVPMSDDEYLRKVKRQQNWSSALLGLAVGVSAANAGYSYSSTSGKANYKENAYGSIYSTRGSVYATSNTVSYNGAAAYAAQQHSASMMANYGNSLYQIRETLNDGYVKRNTLFDGVQCAGYFNIPYRKVDKLSVFVKLGDNIYDFNWTYEGRQGEEKKKKLDPLYEN